MTARISEQNTGVLIHPGFTHDRQARREIRWYGGPLVLQGHI